MHFDFTFRAWTQPAWWPLLLCGLGVVAFCSIVRLYRHEGKLVSPPVRFSLLALRLAAVAVVLFALFEPVMSWSWPEEQLGRIVVAVDLSESMSTADIHATPAEKLRWARALELIGNPSIEARLNRWQAAFDAAGTPEWIDPGEVVAIEKKARLAEARRRNLERILDEAAQLSRKEICLRILTETGAPLLRELEKVARVQLVSFAGNSAATDSKTLRQIAESQPVPATLVPERTDLLQALASGAAPPDGTPLRAVLLLTDGRDNSGHPQAIATRLKGSSIPIHSILLGAKLRPKDLAIAELSYPDTVLKGDQAVVKATLQTSGFAGRALTVFLEQKDHETLTRIITATDTTASVEFPLPAESLGQQRFTIRLEALPEEIRADNNSQMFSFQVVDNYVRVLLVDSEARWEFRFVDNVYKRDPRVKLATVLFQQPTLGLLPQSFFERRLELPADGEQLEDSSFADPDIVIIGDVSPEEFPDSTWKLLEKYVSDSGGTLVLTAGRRNMPAAHKSQILAQLLPVLQPAPLQASDLQADGTPQERGYKLQLSPEGEREPMFQLENDPLRNRALWQELPGHPWTMIGPPKPGATVFAFGVLPGKAERPGVEQQWPLIVHQNYGLGQVLWLGFDSTWRWRFRVGDEYHHRFWGQLARWASESKAAINNGFAKFGPERGEIQEGDDAEIQVQWTSSFLKRFPKLKARAEVTGANASANAKPIATAELRPVESRPLLQVGRILSLPGGDYRVKLVVLDAELGEQEIVAPLSVRKRTTLELSDVSSQAELVQEMAALTGGKVFTPDQAREIVNLLTPPPSEKQLTQEHLLRSDWRLLLVFLTLLGAEWLIRRLHGLP